METITGEPVDMNSEMMTDEIGPKACRAYLVADVGHSHTTVTLYDVIEGSYRLIARGSVLTTAGSPWYDALHGLKSAIAQVSEITGRVLVNRNGRLICPTRMDGTGVDCFGLVVSAADPLRTILVGLLEDVSIASARKAIGTINAIEVDRFSLTDERSENSRLGSLLGKNPDIVFIVGGSDGGTDQRLLDLVDSLAMGISLRDEFQRPEVIYAGNTELRGQVDESLGELTKVQFVENVRPSIDNEQLDDVIGHLADAYGRLKVSEIPGFDVMRDWSSLPILPTAHAFGGITEYFAALHKGPVVGIDIGSASISMAVTRPGLVELTVRSDLGLGKPIINTLKRERPSNILSWLDDQMRETELRDFIYNKSVMPNTVPQDKDEQYLEFSVASSQLKKIVAGLPDELKPNGSGKQINLKLLILRGRMMTNAPQPGPPLLAVLDGLRPVGTFKVVLDSYDVLPAMGLLATHNPQLVVQVLDSGVLKDVGWVVVANGQSEIGNKVIGISIKVGDSEAVHIEIAYGSVYVIPLAAGQEADLSVQPVSGIDVGGGPGRKVELRINGGTLGVLVDARGRPLENEGDDISKRSRQQRWLKAVSS